jgi:alkylation response protein AidB-like acyl-CoA dehydrogenase
MPLDTARHPLVNLPPAEAALVERVRVLVAEQIGPQADAVAREDVFAWDTFRLLAREGVIASAFPRAYGGSEASMLARVRMIEEVGSACSAAASLITGTDLSSRPIVAGGSPALQDALLPRLARGEIQSAFALTEPGAGSDVARLACRFSEAADGSVRVSGSKKFITRADTADVLVVVARREGGPDGAKGLSAFVVPRPSPGLRVSRPIPKLGWNGVPACWVDFDQVAVPADHRLGEEGRGMALAQDTLLRARIGHAAIALGRLRGALLIATQYANRRQVFGRAVGGHQGIQWMVAEMAATLESTRCLVYSAAIRYDQGDPEASTYASIAKMQATDQCMRRVVDCMQLLGGNGYLKAFPMERFFRDAKMNQIGEGTSEVHKNLIGRHVLAQADALPLHPGLALEPDLWCGEDPGWDAPAEA